MTPSHRLTVAALAIATVAACGRPAGRQAKPSPPTATSTPTTSTPPAPSTLPAPSTPASSTPPDPSTPPAPASPTPTTASTARPTTTHPPPVGGSTVELVTAADLPSSWRLGCPVPPSQLRLLHLPYWGFDDRPHGGTMVVNATVVSDVIKVFEALYAEKFPIHQMQPVDAYQGSDPASMAADNTSAFNCRYAVAPGTPHWSAHAYGQAVDVNTVENPYIEGGTVTPPAGAAFVNRDVVRPGMAVAGGPLVRAFASVGWYWGGRWTSSPDYQHFSKTGG